MSLSALGLFACVGAVSLAGLSLVTGVTPCSLMSSCAVACPESDSESAKEVRLVNVANEVKAEETKSCCPLGKLAAASTTAKTTDCSGEAKAACAGAPTMKLVGGRFPIMIPASLQATGSGDCTTASACQGAEAQVVNAAAKGDSCCAGEAAKAQVIAAAAKSESCQTASSCHGTEAQVVNAAAKGESCCASKGAEAKVVAAATKAESCCKTGEAQVVNAAAKGESCCASNGAEAKVVAVAAKTGSCSTKTGVCTRKVRVMGGVAPIVMPAAFVNTKADFCVTSCATQACGDKASSCHTTGAVAAVVPAANVAKGEVCCDGDPATCCRGDETKACCKDEKKAASE